MLEKTTAVKKRDVSFSFSLESPNLKEFQPNFPTNLDERIIHNHNVLQNTLYVFHMLKVKYSDLTPAVLKVVNKEC